MSKARAFPTVAVAAALGVAATFATASPAVATSTTTIATAPPEITLSDTELGLEEYSTAGVEVTAAGLLPGQEVSFQLSPVGEKAQESVTVPADESGVAEHTFVAGDDAQPGEFEIVAQDASGEELAALAFTVTAASGSPTPSAPESQTPSSSPSSSPSGSPSASEAPSSAVAQTAPALSIDPESLPASEFVDQEQGVRISVSGLEPGSIASLRVDSDAATVTSFTMTEAADASGTAIFAVFGLNATRPETYAGRYEVAVSADGVEELTGTFTVTGGSAEAADSNEDASGDTLTEEPSGLPTTGAELAGVGLGLGLLVVGTLTIALSRRRVRESDIGDA